jgi:hypothetical protein
MHPATKPAVPFKTQDASLAAFLVASGHSVLDIAPPDKASLSRFSSFLFEDTPSLREALVAWMDDAPTTLKPRTYAEARGALFARAKEVAR